MCAVIVGDLPTFVVGVLFSDVLDVVVVVAVAVAAAEDV